MNIPHTRWFPAIQVRRSRRLFKTLPVRGDVFARLQAVCESFTPFQSVSAKIITHSVNSIFKGALSHYGKIKGAPLCIAFIGDTRDPCVQEKVGFVGEGIILEATACGLGTCWVGGFFRPEVAASLIQAQEYEKVLAVTPIGYSAEKISLEEKIMTGFGKTHTRKPLEKLIIQKEGEMPEWVREALEAARIAPSAVNRQPWRFMVKQNSITISVDSLKDTYHISKRIDCGIAMLHIELSALYYGMKGTWEFLIPPHVARFTVPA